MNDQNQSTDFILSIYINLEMLFMQIMTVEQEIHFLEINRFASLFINMQMFHKKEFLPKRFMVKDFFPRTHSAVRFKIFQLLV